MATHHVGGRGGAGNFKPEAREKVKADDLNTPTIKQSTYTTGRGGAGNMTSNGDPETARKAQDIEPPKAHSKDMKGTYHWGRGGEGNKTYVGEDGKEKSPSPRRSAGAKDRRRSSRMLEKGKEALGLGDADRRKASENAVAIEDD